MTVNQLIAFVEALPETGTLLVVGTLLVSTGVILRKSLRARQERAEVPQPVVTQTHAEIERKPVPQLTAPQQELNAVATLQ
jgi:hypothetical protein